MRTLLLGNKVLRASKSAQNRHAILVVNLPDKPIFQHPVIPPTLMNHRDVLHPTLRHSRHLELTDEPISYNSRPNGNKDSMIDLSPRPFSTINASTLSIGDNAAFPQTLLRLKIAEEDLKHVMKLGDGAYGEVSNRAPIHLLSRASTHERRLLPPPSPLPLNKGCGTFAVDSSLLSDKAYNTIIIP